MLLYRRVCSGVRQRFEHVLKRVPGRLRKRDGGVQRHLQPAGVIHRRRQRRCVRCSVARIGTAKLVLFHVLPES